ncbi:MAG: hypothetical protein KTR31_08095 [Myxococcales bacterium]|nr:hypothetical protein [Myxococcales bacterium]
MQVRFTALVLAAGCASAPFSRNFEAERAEAICTHAETCDPAGFMALWGNTRECVSDYEASSNRSAAAFRDCELAEGRADACLRAIDEATQDCSPLDEALQLDACLDVWTCSGTRCDEAEEVLVTCDFQMWWSDEEPPDDYCLPGTRDHCNAECAIEARCVGVRGSYSGPEWDDYLECLQACGDG